MSPENMLKSKKAISPILATLLLIVIAVAAIVVTYAWIMTYMGGAGQHAGVILYKANIRFYNVSGAKKIDIDVGNSGTSDTQIIQVYIGTSATNLENQTTYPTLPVSLPAGQIVRLTIDYPWEPSKTYYFKIIPSAGQQPLGPFPEQAPSS
ncbi:MAG: archaellin/type IV pilin N-terminal domain-containing protein [Candidatus Bathyarchaeia archaeon]